VVSTPEKYESQLGLLFPIYGNIYIYNQTTNQICIDIVVSVNPSESDIIQWVSAVQVGINKYSKLTKAPLHQQKWEIKPQEFIAIPTLLDAQTWMIRWFTADRMASSSVTPSPFALEPHSHTASVDFENLGRTWK
jgi:hypothetical protein